MLRNDQTWAAATLTVGQAAMVTAINIVVGTIIAWVLVRDHFPGKAILDAVPAIDVPFALPTIVAGLVLLSLYGPNSPLGVHWAFTPNAVTLALAFVTLPFIVRTVQPVLEELEADVEEAAASLGAPPAYRSSAGSTSSRASLRLSQRGRPCRSPAPSRSTARSCC